MSDNLKTKYTVHSTEHMQQWVQTTV